MTRADAIIDEIRDRWGKQGAAQACELIINFIISHSKQQTEMLSYEDLGRVSGLPADSSELQLAITILATRYAALKTEYVFFSLDGHPHYLDAEERAEFLKDGHFGDPSSGDTVPDAGAQIYPYFTGQRDLLVSEVPR